MERNRLGELQLDLMALRGKLDEADAQGDAEAAHHQGDRVLSDALRLLAGWFAPPVSEEIRALADRFDDLRRSWWYG